MAKSAEIVVRINMADWDEVKAELARLGRIEEAAREVMLDPTPKWWRLEEALAERPRQWAIMATQETG